MQFDSPDPYPYVDGDQDGMANSWELAYATFHPWGDNDGDGWTNLEEYLNKTNPIVANDPMAEVESQVDGALY